MKYIYQNTTPYALSLLDMELASEHASKTGQECVFFTEHADMFSAGKSSLDKDFKTKSNLPIYFPSRGGKVTVHSIGQIVVYPIINLYKRNLNVSSFVAILENWMIDVLKLFAIEGHLSKLGVGVFSGSAKIGFIGIKIHHGISTHGLSLNVSNDLSLFQKIIPCGLTNVELTSIEKILNKKIKIKTIANAFIKTSPF